MGACATKPRDSKEEGEAPLPLPAEEKEAAAEEVSADVKLEEKEDENKRTSLSNLFREVKSLDLWDLFDTVSVFMLAFVKRKTLC